MSVGLTSVLINRSGSKTNQCGQSEVITIEQEALSPASCPVKALRQFIQIHPRNSEVLFVHFNGAPLSRQQFQSVLKKAARVLGWSVDGFSSHSFRIGAATTAADEGIPLEIIMRKGRWKSSAVSGYIRLDLA